MSNPLEDWLAAAVAELGVADAWSPAHRDLVLDLARDVAHGVARPAAPLTTYLAGLAVGRGADVTAVARRVAALAAEQADRRAAGTGSAADAGDGRDGQDRR